ncbi:hypothetical protein [Roseibacillus ishigakijimensis]|uniref:Verru_Chthon cassette protein A n=1 Tax=Roseibacillus ishigakijimensis TaxID=454146 RepID=A0A934RUC2_9BACT|nr:hypothetical protein [Roseibacillus ishigakijimensis]MBK1834636.1 hypothetical protein [Roseibacillus ishigakijimensis]
MKTTTIRKKARWRSEGQGFSLVLVVTLMILLSLIAMGILGLGASVLRGSASEAGRQLARANARLALQLAIARLQESLGPDQRVCARADLLRERAEMEELNWVGVWRTTDQEGESYWKRTVRDGGLTDTRFFSGNSWSPEDEVLDWLVSGPRGEGSAPDPQRGVQGQAVALVAAGSIGDEAAAGVSAPRVPVRMGEGEDLWERGGYAWWVGDQGAKANVGSPDRLEMAGKTSLTRHYQRAGAQDVELWGEDVAPERKARLVGRTGLSLVGLDPQASFHDLTTASAGLFVNTREGGLQRDLTWYLHGKGRRAEDLRDGTTVVSAGIADSDRLVGPANNEEAMRAGLRLSTVKSHLIAPTFRSLRTWSELAQEGGTTRDALFSAEEARPGAMADAYDHSNPRPVALQDLSHQSLRPVLVEGSIYYGLSYYADPNPAPAGRVPSSGEEFPARNYRLRIHLFPRVVLWNPYNVSLRVPETALALLVNGAKCIEATYQDGSMERFKMYLGRTHVNEQTGGMGGSAQQGTLYFHLASTVIPPGESFLFSPPDGQEYSERKVGRNVLVPTAPDTTRNFYLSLRPDADNSTQVFRRVTPPAIGPDGETLQHLNGSLRLPVLSFREVADGVQADDYRMLWKHGVRGKDWTPEDFDTWPMAQFVSCALQYGDNRELPVVWAEQLGVPVVATQAHNPLFSQVPDRRTRDGFRMRWFRETVSNERGSGILAETSHFQDAQMANWNMRGSYSLRTPWENVTDTTPAFFGNYTRDLFDEVVSYDSLRPFGVNAFPFGTPGEGPERLILFELPAAEADILSLGAFQHANLSELMWAPSFVVGNSLADPRITDPRGTELEAKSVNNRQTNGWNRYTIGWDDSGEGRSDDPDKWAFYARHLMQNLPESKPRGEDVNLLYDLSYEVNHTLWDRFFLSTGGEWEKKDFVKNPAKSPLPNSRLLLLGAGNEDDTFARLNDCHFAAGSLMLEGMFNVNSTSVEAWKAVLSSNKGTDQRAGEGVPFGRLLRAPAGSRQAGEAGSEDSFAGTRVLDEQEVTSLAEAMVEQVRARGPFLSLSDFVNRRLVNAEEGKKGALQAAIDQSGINGSFEGTYELNNEEELPDYRHPDNIWDATRLNQTLKPDTVAWGVPGFLTQADVLQVIGMGLSARSETFLVRAYGDAKNKAGQVIAKAWCEATVQRFPEPVEPDSHGLNPLVKERGEIDWGRRFRLTSFRWLREEEV